MQESKSPLSREDQQHTCLEILRLRKALVETPPEDSVDRRKLEHAHRVALDKLIRHNQGIVITQARRMARACRILDSEDLAQWGNVGLLRAIDKFDPSKGVLFTSYAIWWVRAYIGRALAHEDLGMKVPGHVVSARRKLGKVSADFERHNGRAPTHEELALESTMPQELVDEVLSVQYAAPLSLDCPLLGAQEYDRYDVLPSQGPSPEEEAARKEDEVVALGLLSTLGDRERKVVSERFWNDRTLDEIGRGMPRPVTRERARQIEAEAMKKLRAVACGESGAEDGPPFRQGGRGNRSRVTA